MRSRLSGLPLASETSMADTPTSAEIEFSSLSRSFTEDDITIGIEIFRAKDTIGQWYLEIAITGNEHIGWDEPFETDEEAYDFLMELIDERGMAELVARPPDPADQAWM